MGRKIREREMWKGGGGGVEDEEVGKVVGRKEIVAISGMLLKEVGHSFLVDLAALLSLSQVFCFLS